MSHDKGYYHDKGEQDASNDRYSPPHQGPVFSDNWWDSDMSGRPTDPDKQADYDAYQQGRDNANNQK